MAQKTRNDLLSLAYSDDGSAFVLVTGKTSVNPTEVTEDGSLAQAAPWPASPPTPSARYIMMVIG